MPTYKQKPIEVQALQFVDGTTYTALQTFFDIDFIAAHTADSDVVTGLMFDNKYGRQSVDTDSWILKTSDGYSVCTPDLFDATYDPV